MLDREQLEKEIKEMLDRNGWPPTTYSHYNGNTSFDRFNVRDFSEKIREQLEKYIGEEIHLKYKRELSDKNESYYVLPEAEPIEED